MAVRPDHATVRVTENVQASRFEAFLDDALEDTLAGFVDYSERNGVFALTHTEVFGRYEGRGIGSSLVVQTLAALRDRGGQVLPLCPFVPKVIRDHPEFTDLVPADQRARFGLADGQTAP